MATIKFLDSATTVLELVVSGVQFIDKGTVSLEPLVPEPPGATIQFLDKKIATLTPLGGEPPPPDEPPPDDEPPVSPPNGEEGWKKWLAPAAIVTGLLLLLPSEKPQKK